MAHPMRITCALLAAATLSGCGRLAAAATPVPPAGLAGAVSKSTLTYCSPGGVGQTLDLYTPNPRPGHPLPVVVYVHGGGWTKGTSAISPGSVVGQAAASLLSQGFAVASINYRLAPRFPWPAQIDDSKCAVRFLRAQATTLGINPDALGAMGSSAGGHLVSLMGLAGPSAGFDVGQYLDQSSAVQAVVDQFGPADLTTSDWADSARARQVAAEVFGVEFGQPAPVLAEASPVTYITATAPPFLVQQGADDTLVPPGQSQELVQRLTTAGDRATLEMVANAGHGFIPSGAAPISPSSAQLAGDAAAFFSRTLG